MMLFNVAMRTRKSTLQVCMHDLGDAGTFVDQPPVSLLELSSPNITIIKSRTIVPLSLRNKTLLSASEATLAQN